MSVQEMKTLEIGNEEYEVVDEKARPVKSVAEMKAMSNIVAGNIIKTIGYYSANDGGGATYLIREKLETDVEDLGAIHFINDNLVAEIIVNKIMNVKQFGAKGDGITDDTVAIQNAINNANHIVFPHGEYLVSIGEIQNSYGFYYALNIPSNKIVDFGTATIKCNPVNGDIKEKYTIIYLNECDNVKVSNGKIIGDLDNHIGTITEYGHAITTFRCTNSKIDNVGKLLIFD